MKSYRRRYFVLLLFSLLLHLALYWWLLHNVQLISEPESADTKTVEVLLRPKDKPEPPAPEQLQQLPQEEIVSEDEPLTPEPTETPEPKEQESPKPEPPEQQDIPEAAPAPVDNADQFASDNQEDRSKTQVDFGASPKTKKADKTKLSDQVKAPEPKEEPATLSREEETKKEVKPAEIIPEKLVDKEKPIKRIITADTDQSEITSSKYLSKDKPKEKVEIKPDTPLIPTPETEIEQAGKSVPDLLDMITGEAYTQGERLNFELEISQEDLDSMGNMKILSESLLREAEIQQPFSEQKSKELQLANEYLEQMNKQVMAFWVNPYKGAQVMRGIIKLELDAMGFIQDVYVYQSSGNALLDISVEDAIRSVRRFQVPDNEIIASRYYQNLRFHYSSIEPKTELMPFEKEED